MEISTTTQTTIVLTEDEREMLEIILDYYYDVKSKDRSSSDTVWKFARALFGML